MKIAVAMSGGVDSSLAAVMLKNMGHEIVGLTAKILLCSEMDGSEPRYDVCCSPENIHDAKRIAQGCGFPHVLVNIEDDFSREIIDPFCREYLRGRTPSPCIHCNAKLKFKKLIDQAKELGCEKLATGHYARINTTDEGRHYISTGIDKDKDQSYFLFMLDQDILDMVLFPLGEYKKTEIREMARKENLSVADKPESQEICFVFDDDYPGYIERRTGTTPLPGDIINRQGKKLGTHRGIHRYTIGQRRGLGISAESPLYVIEIRPDENVVVAGFRGELSQKGLLAKGVHYMKRFSLNGIRAFVKTRSTQIPVAAQLKESADTIEVLFDEPQQGISPGQAVVFYNERGDVLGGAWIEKGF